MDFVDYREKLGIGFSDIEKQKVFIQRIKILLMNNFSSFEFKKKDEINFCYELGIQTWIERQPDRFLYDEPFGMYKVLYYLSEFRGNFNKFLYALIVFVNILPYNSEMQKKLIKTIELALNDSHIQYDLITDSKKVFIFPQGAKELDKALVSDTLDWLSAYPITQKVFTDSLKLYSEASDSNASIVADNFRKSLETFLQEFFNSDKSLENLKSEYGNYLKQNGVPSEISNNLENLLNLYARFINNNAKHHDKTKKNVLEFIMYQTGNIIRLLITLSKETI